MPVQCPAAGGCQDPAAILGLEASTMLPFHSSDWRVGHPLWSYVLEDTSNTLSLEVIKQWSPLSRAFKKVEGARVPVLALLFRVLFSFFLTEITSRQGEWWCRLPAEQRGS